jgi:ADP-heptose:LPS heptosyltransferase
MDKQIKLQVDLQDLTTLTDTIGIMNLMKMILVHPGKGWKSKTFPDTYWQEIINRLAELTTHKVAVIGKYVSDEQGLVDLKCPENVLDLRNLLNLGELMALISQAEVLISNDSAPVHIAGAFDNWVVFLPSCKHPDHVLPYRNGSKSYKTVSLYKKLTCDAIDSAPTQVYGQTIDKVVGDIREYLPDVSDVVETINKIIKP